jgi:hypothetical protein
MLLCDRLDMDDYHFKEAIEAVAFRRKLLMSRSSSNKVCVAKAVVYRARLYPYENQGVVVCWV